MLILQELSTVKQNQLALMKDVAKIKSCLVRHVPDEDDRSNLIGILKQFDNAEEFDGFC